MFSVLILAAGSSIRMGGGNKQIISLEGEPVLHRSVRAFAGIDKAEEILIVCRGQDVPDFTNMLSDLLSDRIRLIPAGGATRQQSVENALQYLSSKTTHIAIHDGARPLVREEDIRKTFALAEEKGSALLGVFARDTIKVIADGKVAATPDRRTLFLAQTPQAFSKAEYFAAMADAKEKGLDFTDDAQLFEMTGRPVYIAEGHFDNLKITTPEDVPLAEGCLRAMKGE